MKLLVISSIWALPIIVAAETNHYQCKIKSVLDLNKTGSIVTHGWSANYLNREFTINSETGKVISTTALKVRLSNYDKNNQPIVMHEPHFRSVTVFPDKNNYAAIEIQLNEDGVAMPYFYRTNVGMMLTGTCQGTDSE